MDTDHPRRPKRQYLTLAEIARQLGFSPRTAVRYHAEYTPYLTPYATPGGGRGLLPDAVQVFRLIHDLKTHRAHWTQIQHELDARFGQLPFSDHTTATKSFQRSLEGIRQSHELIASELRLLFREVNYRLVTLEESVRQLQALLPLPQRLVEERSRRELAVARARDLIEKQQRQIQQLKGETPNMGSLFPEFDEDEGSR